MGQMVLPETEKDKAHSARLNLVHRSYSVWTPIWRGADGLCVC